MLSQLKELVFRIAPVTPAEWELVERGVVLRKLKSGDFLLRPGEVCTHMHFINKGACRMYYTKNTEEINTYFAFENEFMGSYQSFLSRTPSRYYIQTLEDTEVLEFSYELIQEGFDKHFNWNKFGRVIAEQFFLMMEKRMESFLFLNAEERYLELVKHYPNIFERVALYHIASYLGIKGPSLSRIRKRLVKPGKKEVPVL